MRCGVLVATLALSGLVASSQAWAYNGFNYLQDLAWGQYQDVCGNYACDGFNGGTYDVGEADANAAYAAGWAADSLTYYQNGDNGWGGCGSSKNAAYRYIGSAWYYLNLPHSSGGDYDQGQYDNAWYITNNIQENMDYYLADCSED